MADTWMQCIVALVLCASSCGGRSADLTGTMAGLAPEYAKLIQERPHFGVYALINNVACAPCGCFSYRAVATQAGEQHIEDGAKKLQTDFSRAPPSRQPLK
ncbi:hypothetical protein HPB50_009137 [Hyalomma asiaticum]|uniref:Uncharacterized protein n=1 Tax=Hyalomma asiaticum TaxID=266040 RepID=A0ACB7SZ33_HYAAI|nr:hypothetical protein HPB50_009137 [Hyalomma asiaticum]